MLNVLSQAMNNKNALFGIHKAKAFPSAQVRWNGIEGELILYAVQYKWRAYLNRWMEIHLYLWLHLHILQLVARCILRKVYLKWWKWCIFRFCDESHQSAKGYRSTHKCKIKWRELSRQTTFQSKYTTNCIVFLSFNVRTRYLTCKM